MDIFRTSSLPMLCATSEFDDSFFGASAREKAVNHREWLNGLFCLCSLRLKIYVTLAEGHLPWCCLITITDTVRETSRLYMHKHMERLRNLKKEVGSVRTATVDVSGSGGGSGQWRSVQARNGQRWHRIGRCGAERCMK